MIGLSRLTRLGLLAAALASPGLAEDRVAKWEFPEQPGWAKPHELVFTVPASGVVRFEGEIRPYCECGRGGFGYFQFEHRLVGRREWVDGLPKALQPTDHLHRPAPWVDGQPAWDVVQMFAAPDVTRYEFRVVVRANTRQVGSAFVTPAQTLAVSLVGAVAAGDPKERGLDR